MWIDPRTMHFGSSILFSTTFCTISSTDCDYEMASMTENSIRLIRGCWLPLINVANLVVNDYFVKPIFDWTNTFLNGYCCWMRSSKFRSNKMSVQVMRSETQFSTALMFGVFLCVWMNICVREFSLWNVVLSCTHIHEKELELNWNAVKQMPFTS